MSKAAHNSCQARAEIPTGLGMHQKSTFAMSRLRHKRSSWEDSSRLWHLFGLKDFPTEKRPLSVLYSRHSFFFMPGLFQWLNEQ